jgi:hypothetical protein
MVNKFYKQCAGKEDGDLRSGNPSERRPGGYGKGTWTRLKAKALAARAEAMVPGGGSGGPDEGIPSRGSKT